jgi:N-acetylglucosaminyldiphosphoundecaprenol N-acetyl-beta-D-mannosaminyltransferase
VGNEAWQASYDLIVKVHPPDASVIILSWNRISDTLDAIRSALDQEIPGLEIVVVDAASTDGSADAIASLFPEVRLVRLEENLGVAANRNIGIHNSSGEVLFFLDNDAELSSSALAQAIEFFQKVPTVAAIGVKVVTDWGAEIDQGSWIYPFASSEYADCTFLTYTFTGGACAIRRSALVQSGGFWEPLFFAREEEDLAFRLMEAGFDIAYFHRVEVRHKVSTEARTHPGRKLALDLRNMVWITWRYLPIITSIRLTLLRVLAYLWRGLRAGSVSDVLQGLREAANGFPMVWRSRRPISYNTLRRYRELNPRLRPFGRTTPILLPDERPRSTGPLRVNVLDTGIDVVTKLDLLTEISNLCDPDARNKRPLHIVTLNLNILRCAIEDTNLRSALNDARVVADGVPLIWISRVLGQPLPQRINGTDLVWDLARLSSSTGIRLFLFGSTNDVLADARARIESALPHTDIVGTYAPAMGDWCQTEDQKAVATIKAAAPDVLLVALGAPKQELWISSWLEETGVRVAIGIGGSLDIIAGHYRRAPVWAQRSGLEWLFRLLQDPFRLFRRYILEDLPLLLRALRLAVWERIGSS